MTMTHQRADDTLSAALSGATPYVWLHTGDPGEDGTSNVAQVGGSDIDRKSVDFNTPENHSSNEERICTNSTEVTWSGSDIDEDQLITHFSLWDAETGGQPEFIAELDNSKTTATYGANIAIEDLIVAISVHAKPTS